MSIKNQQGEWFKYTGIQFKDECDIRCASKSEYTCCRQNEDSFYCKEGRFSDKDVTHVRLK